MKRLAILPLLFSASFANDHAPGQFQHHADIEVSLFAQEPMVLDPVCLAFAGNGDAFVVEGRDYPYGFGPERKPGGTIRLLRDTNGDGKADHSVVFAEGLSFPTSVTCWRKGILVAAPPQIVYLEDTDGDDKADVRKVVLDGFKLGVTDSNMNSLRWGLDNKVHGVNAGNGGRIFSPDRPDQKTDLGQYDFAFDPDTGAVELTYRTAGGFGLVFDDFGHRFTTHNTNYLQQQIIAKRYLDNNPNLPPFETTVNISVHGESARIYPISEAQTRVNHPEQAGHFSSSGGMGILPPGLFPAKFDNSIFVCDVVGNLVHRDLLRENKSIFFAHRAPEEQTSEFLASRDPAFRPVGLEQGPDGALYLLDMQRDVIEHPDYIPAKTLAKLDIRAGDNRGRIYRITPKGGFTTPYQRRDWSKATPAELVEGLSSPNMWDRVTTHRMLAERGVPSVLEVELRRLARQASGRTCILALSLLRRAKLEHLAEIEACLEAAEPSVREAALQALELGGYVEQIAQFAPKLLRDPDRRVHFQATLTLGASRHPDRASELAKVFAGRKSWDVRLWSTRAIWTALSGVSLPFVEKGGHAMFRNGSPRLQSQGMPKLGQAELTALIAAEVNENTLLEFERVFQQLTDPFYNTGLFIDKLAAAWSRKPLPPDVAERVAALVTRFIQTKAASYASTHGQPLLEDLGGPLLALFAALKKEPPAELVAAVDRAIQFLAEAHYYKRLDALVFLGKANSAKARAALLDHLAKSMDREEQRAALQGLAAMPSDDLGMAVVAKWSTFSPVIRKPVIDLLLSRRAYQAALLTGLEKGEIKVSELNLDLEQRRGLLRESTPEMAQRAAKFWGDEEYSNRKALVEEWLAKLPATGDATLGAEIFGQHCALCHKVGDVGHAVGPELTAQAHRSVEDLLTHILDPNMAINPNYVSCIIETKDGALFTGLLASETPTELTLRLQNAVDQTVPRERIAKYQTLSTSLMPEGFEKTLSPEQMRALIAFLQAKK